MPSCKLPLLKPDLGYLVRILAEPKKKGTPRQPCFATSRLQRLTASAAAVGFIAVGLLPRTGVDQRTLRYLAPSNPSRLLCSSRTIYTPQPLSPPPNKQYLRGFGSWYLLSDSTALVGTLIMGVLSFLSIPQSHVKSLLL